MTSAARAERSGTPGASGAFASRSSLLALLLAATLALSCSQGAAARDNRTIARPRAEGAGVVDAMVPHARAALQARGLVIPVEPAIVIHPDAASFARATRQQDPALRAWTTYRTVHFMPLSTWARADDVAVRERVTHELCHVALYQSFGSEERAVAARIPRFFDEGVCSVIAGQARADVAAVVALAPPAPLSTEMFRADPEVAYAAAHHAIAWLDATLGPAWLNRVLAQAAEDDGGAGCIERALRAITGHDAASLWRAVVDAGAAPA